MNKADLKNHPGSGNLFDENGRNTPSSEPIDDVPCYMKSFDANMNVGKTQLFPRASFHSPDNKKPHLNIYAPKSLNVDSFNKPR